MKLARPKQDVLEDLEFLDQHAVGAFEAADRVGFASAEAMERWLTRADLYPLWQRFKHRDPPGSHDGMTRRRMNRSSPEPPPEEPPAEPEEDSYEDFLDRAGKSTRARTRARAEKIKAQLAELYTVLEEEAVEDEKLERIAELEKQLRELRSTVAKPSGASTGDAGVIRAWAEVNGIEVPERGRIPGSVRAQYEASLPAEGDPA